MLFPCFRWKKSVAARPATATKPENLLLLALDWGPAEAERVLKVVGSTACANCCALLAPIAPCCSTKRYTPAAHSPHPRCMPQARHAAAQRAELQGHTFAKGSEQSEARASDVDEDDGSLYMCAHDGRERTTRCDVAPGTRLQLCSFAAVFPPICCLVTSTNLLPWPRVAGVQLVGDTGKRCRL